MKERFIIIMIFQDWDVSSNENQGSLACDEVESINAYNRDGFRLALYWR